MSKEYRKIGRGFEHTVYRAHYADGRDSAFVIKKPHKYVLWLMDRSGLGVNEVRRQFDSAQALVEGSQTVVIPPTTIFDFSKQGKSGYLIAQRYVERDSSVPEMREALVRESSSEVVDSYDMRPSNFLSSKKKIYWVDPSHHWHTSMQKITGINTRNIARHVLKVVKKLRLGI